MPYLIGTDEAGYGPNLGPLVISATLWRIPAGKETDLYEIAPAAISRTAEDPSQWVIADSKQLYSPGRGFDLLERHVLAGLAMLERDCSTWHKLKFALTGQCCPPVPWHEEDHPLPCAAVWEECLSLAAAAKEALSAADVALLDVRSSAIFPEEFNALVDQCGNKATALSQSTLALVKKIAEGAAGEEVLVLCDKHGGRNRYAALLQHAFPDSWVRAGAETSSLSSYTFLHNQAPFEFRFSVRCERFAPVGLASMVSKYLRELAMQSFNRYWQAQIPGLRPTAGYPVDAKRFMRETSDARRKLQVSDNSLWRNR